MAVGGFSLQFRGHCENDRIPGDLLSLPVGFLQRNFLGRIRRLCLLHSIIWQYGNNFYVSVQLSFQNLVIICSFRNFSKIQKFSITK